MLQLYIEIAYNVCLLNIWAVHHNLFETDSQLCYGFSEMNMK